MRPAALAGVRSCHFQGAPAGAANRRFCWGQQKLSAQPTRGMPAVSLDSAWASARPRRTRGARAARTGTSSRSSSAVLSWVPPPCAIGRRAFPWGPRRRDRRFGSDNAGPHGYVPRGGFAPAVLSYGRRDGGGMGPASASLASCRRDLAVTRHHVGTDARGTRLLSSHHPLTTVKRGGTRRGNVPNNAPDCVKTPSFRRVPL